MESLALRAPQHRPPQAAARASNIPCKLGWGCCGARRASRTAVNCLAQPPSRPAAQPPSPDHSARAHCWGRIAGGAGWDWDWDVNGTSAVVLPPRQTPAAMKSFDKCVVLGLAVLAMAVAVSGQASLNGYDLFAQWL